jgi:threonine/homoserine/homoserine lactone efflux protein
MFDAATLVAFTIAAAAVVIVPGPTVSIIVANALRRGSAAGLANVAGTQVAVATMIAVLAAGLDVVVAVVGEAFFWVKLAGAAYLVWLGVKTLRSDGRLAEAAAESRSMRGYFVQGFLVLWSNPKALLFFGAFIPQFVNPAHAAAPQVAVYGFIFMAVATVLDGAYALAAGGARRFLTANRVRIAERVGGTVLIAGGLGLLASRR